MIAFASANNLQIIPFFGSPTLADVKAVSCIKTIMYHLFSRLRSLVTHYPVAQVGSMYVVVKLKEDY